MRAFSLLMLGAAACATATAGGDTVTMLSNVDYHAGPVTYAIGSGHVRSQGDDLDAVLDKNCVRGEMAGEPLNLCETEQTADGSQRWEGTSGQVTIRPIENGKAFKVDGYVTLRALRDFDVSQVLRPQEGGGWDKLRSQPVLLLMATTATDLRALRHRHHI